MVTSNLIFLSPSSPKRNSATAANPAANPNSASTDILAYLNFKFLVSLVPFTFLYTPHQDSESIVHSPLFRLSSSYLGHVATLQPPQSSVFPQRHQASLLQAIINQQSKAPDRTTKPTFNMSAVDNVADTLANTHIAPVAPTGANNVAGGEPSTVPLTTQ